ncbi:hypothetical protein JGU71_15335 [Antrihabitans sp. YC3-6]|uniref:Serine hydrolase n=1 Tax=Antrihabitans stalagmiti TaxID=2799499 RepID=A0A934U4Y6_9NOCA|nr:hypothetical protein [Antrihabitans stalagmiti]MBJ8340263.1 hypothetical protein [Antrihabitans stalagmiti]
MDTRTTLPAAALALGASLAVLLPAFASATPAASDNLTRVPDRTAITVIDLRTGSITRTPNASEPRPALSMVKLYIADYALRHGDRSITDLDLVEQMIRYSDDFSASQLESKYPTAIDATAAEFRLTDTTAGPDWGTSYTTTDDVANFLRAKLRSDRGSPIFPLMATADRVASDGTIQDWGTSTVPAVTGSKWGWSDMGSPMVASASVGPGFVVAATTFGPGDIQTADVADAFSTDTHKP